MIDPIHRHQHSQINENWKRHSYAGEQPETTPYLLLNRALNRTVNAPYNWKRPSDSRSVASLSQGGYAGHQNTPAQSFADRLAQRKTTNLPERNSNVWRSFNGTDNHIRFLQQHMPTLEHTTKSFLRNWRIESYLNDRSLEFRVDFWDFGNSFLRKLKWTFSVTEMDLEVLVYFLSF